MIGIVIVSHGELAGAFHQAAIEIVGPQPLLEFVGVERGANLDIVRDELARKLGAMPSDGVLFLVDVCGGTPWNLCLSEDIVGGRPIAMVAGINLPLVLKALMSRTKAQAGELDPGSATEPDDQREQTHLQQLADALAAYGKSRIIPDSPSCISRA